mmetsp:Transcript_28215/g.73994  ORF Transcript_28215/g.73994 Transcript_28215/m.73994 type:complete len:213 (+) Transcript_28215:339-977(+)
MYVLGLVSGECGSTVAMSFSTEPSTRRTTSFTRISELRYLRPTGWVGVSRRNPFSASGRKSSAERYSTEQTGTVCSPIAGSTGLFGTDTVFGSLAACSPTSSTRSGSTATIARTAVTLSTSRTHASSDDGSMAVSVESVTPTLLQNVVTASAGNPRRRSADSVISRGSSHPWTALLSISLPILRFDTTVYVTLSREYSHCTGQYTSTALQSQ